MDFVAGYCCSAAGAFCERAVNFSPFLEEARMLSRGGSLGTMMSGFTRCGRGGPIDAVGGGLVDSADEYAETVRSVSSLRCDLF